MESDAYYQNRYRAFLENRSYKFATFAGGCSWCIEGPYLALEGVADVFSGYSGGNVENPSYERVHQGDTGHREAVQVFYDPNKVSYKKLVEIFWYQIDPTDSGGQFYDRGEQYTTAIFYNNEEEQSIAQNSKETVETSKKYEKPIATKILKYTNFYLASNYHQKYYLNNPGRYSAYELGSGRKAQKEENKKQLSAVFD